ncbi:hypothetical protein [Desulforamulus ruminis]|uniref:hypothetical protein n=1 Tax=Desulforamulus ruminis TaxID=1564 RepID=UPI003083AEDC
MLGPMLGGIIVNGLNRRWTFYVNIPICMVALLLAWRGLPTDKPTSLWASACLNKCSLGDNRK